MFPVWAVKWQRNDHCGEFFMFVEFVRWTKHTGERSRQNSKILSRVVETLNQLLFVLLSSASDDNCVET